jgi:anti-anti-sigma factor
MTLFSRLRTQAKEEDASGRIAEGDIRVIASGAQPRVAVSGRLTVNTCPRLRSVVCGLISKSAGGLDLDLSGLTHIDTTGAAALLETLNFAHEHSVRLRLVGVTGQPRRLAEIAQLDQIFGALGSEVEFR